MTDPIADPWQTVQLAAPPPNARVAAFIRPDFTIAVIPLDFMVVQEQTTVYEVGDQEEEERTTRVVPAIVNMLGVLEPLERGSGEFACVGPTIEACAATAQKILDGMRAAIAAASAVLSPKEPAAVAPIADDGHPSPAGAPAQTSEPTEGNADAT